MEPTATELIKILKQNAFSREVSADLLESRLPRLGPEEEIEMLEWLQEESFSAEEHFEKTLSSNIQLCLIQTWEHIRKQHRKRGSLDAQLYEAQLPQVYMEGAQRCLAASDLLSTKACLHKCSEAIRTALEIDDRLLRSAGYLHGWESVSCLRLQCVAVWVELHLNKKNAEEMQLTDKQQTTEAENAIKMQLSAWRSRLPAAAVQELISDCGFRLAALSSRAFSSNSFGLALLLGGAAEAALQLCNKEETNDEGDSLQRMQASVAALSGECYFRMRKPTAATQTLQRVISCLIATGQKYNSLYFHVLTVSCCALLSLQQQQQQQQQQQHEEQQKDDAERSSYGGLELQQQLQQQLQQLFAADAATEHVQLFLFCCQHHTMCESLSVLNSAAKINNIKLRAELAHTVVSYLQQQTTATPAAAAAASPVPAAARTTTPAAAAAATREQSESCLSVCYNLELVLKTVVEKWREESEENLKDEEKKFSSFLLDVFVDFIELLLQQQRWADAIQWIEQIEAAAAAAAATTATAAEAPSAAAPAAVTAAETPSAAAPAAVTAATPAAAATAAATATTATAAAATAAAKGGLDNLMIGRLSLHLAFAFCRSGQPLKALEVLDREEVSNGFKAAAAAAAASPAGAAAAASAASPAAAAAAEAEGDRLCRTRELLRLSAFLSTGSNEAAVSVCISLSKGAPLSREEAFALCSECFSNNETTDPRVALQCLLLLLTALARAAPQDVPDSSSSSSSSSESDSISNMCSSSSNSNSSSNSRRREFLISSLSTVLSPQTTRGCALSSGVTATAAAAETAAATAAAAAAAGEKEEGSNCCLLQLSALMLQKSREAKCSRDAALRLCNLLGACKHFSSAEEPEAAKYINAFCCAEGGMAFTEAAESSDPEQQQKIYFDSAELYSLAAHCATETEEKETNIFLAASAVVAAARSKLQNLSVGAPSVSLLQGREGVGGALFAAAAALNQLQIHLRGRATKTRASENLLRLCLLLEFEGACLLSVGTTKRKETRKRKKTTAEAEREAQTEIAEIAAAAATEEEEDEANEAIEEDEEEENEGDKIKQNDKNYIVFSPKQIAEKAFKEDLLGLVGSEMLLSTALETADEEIISSIAIQVLGVCTAREAGDLRFIASGFRRAVCLEQRREEKLYLITRLAENKKLLAHWPLTELRWIAGQAWYEGVLLFRGHRHAEAEKWLSAAVLIAKERKEVLSDSQQISVFSFFSVCSSLAAEEISFKKLRIQL